MLYAGRDATEEFNMLHDPKVRSLSTVGNCCSCLACAGHPAVRTGRCHWHAEEVEGRLCDCVVSPTRQSAGMATLIVDACR